MLIGLFQNQRYNSTEFTHSIFYIPKIIIDLKRAFKTYNSVLVLPSALQLHV